MGDKQSLWQWGVGQASYLLFNKDPFAPTEAQKREKKTGVVMKERRKQIDRAERKTDRMVASAATTWDKIEDQIVVLRGRLDEFMDMGLDAKAQKTARAIARLERIKDRTVDTVYTVQEKLLEQSLSLTQDEGVLLLRDVTGGADIAERDDANDLLAEAHDDARDGLQAAADRTGNSLFETLDEEEDPVADASFAAEMQAARERKAAREAKATRAVREEQLAEEARRDAAAIDALQAMPNPPNNRGDGPGAGAVLVESPGHRRRASRVPVAARESPLETRPGDGSNWQE